MTTAAAPARRQLRRLRRDVLGRPALLPGLRRRGAGRCRRRSPRSLPRCSRATAAEEDAGGRRTAAERGDDSAAASCRRPRVAAVAVMGCSRRASSSGSVTGQLAQSAGLRRPARSAPSPQPRTVAAEAADGRQRPRAEAAAPAPAPTSASRAPAPVEEPAAEARRRTPVAAGTAGPKRLPAGQARVPDRARRPGLRRDLRQELDRALPREDPAANRASC